MTGPVTFLARHHAPGAMACRMARTLVRTLAFSITAVVVVLSAGPRAGASEDGWAAVTGGSIVLLRHAEAPGTGDPAGFRVDECETQRNLSPKGREQAVRIGEAFRVRGIAVGKVLSSQWCRCVHTAELAFPGRVEREPAFNSFFANRSNEPRQTAAARSILAAWSGPGVLVVSTHQVNIAALTGVSPGSGEGIVLRPEGGNLKFAGRIKP